MAFCVSCGTRLPEAARFCPTCGAEVHAEAPAEETLKLVTVLFADVVSSTARAESMHPEDVRELMLGYFDAMVGEIEAEGGVVEKFVGDAVMAVFGVPTAREDDALRAVRAARRMLARLHTWNASREPHERLEVRIGIETGEVLAAATPRADLLVTGDAVNLAARLQEAAEPGRIVVGETTARLVRGAFALDALGALPLKGRAEPVPAWAVVDELEPAEAARGRLVAPLVGREPELEVLRSVLGRVEAKRAPHLVTVTGDPGVGKSRLVEEFAASLEEGTKLLVGRCLSYGEGVTLRPLGEILATESGVLENDTPEAALAKIALLVDDAVAAGVAVDRDRTTAALASTLGLERAEDTGGVDPREARHRLMTAWRALLTHLAATKALVLVVEDLHWADQAMLDVLEDLAEHVEGPVLFVCAARPDLFRIRPNWGGGKHNYSSVALAPLVDDESARLVSLLLRSEELPGGARRSILARGEGNPFFLEEIVRRLVDEHRIERAGGRWEVRGQLAELEIPETVQGVILARIDLLSPSERRALQEAAVVGRVFWSGALGYLLGSAEPQELLRALCERELVSERLSSTIAGQTEYAFRHVLTRDVAYESLPRRERARAHARVAAWIEEVTGARAQELAEILAHHYDVAYALSEDDASRRSARHNYLLASRRALRTFALAQAEYLSRQAVRLSVERPERLEALEALGDLSAAAHAGDDAWRAYGDGLALAGEDTVAEGRLAAKAAVQATRWYGGMREHPSVDELERLIDRGLAATGEADSVWRALLLMSRGFELVWGFPEAQGRSQDAAQAALAIAERLDDPNLLSGSLDAVGSLLLARGRYGEYLRFGRRRIDLVPRLTDVAEIGDAFQMGAWSATYVGLYEEAVAHATACVERTQGIDPGEYVHGLGWRVWARAMTGDWEGALADQAELERIQAETVGARVLPYTLKAYSAAAFVRELRGETAEAAAYLDRIDPLHGAERRTGSFPDGEAALALAARALVHRGRADEARAWFDPDPQLRAPPTLEALCEIVAAQEDWDAAPGMVAAARRQAAVSEALALPLFADRLEGRLAAAEGDDARAAALLRRSAEGFAERGAPWEEGWSRRLLAEVLLRLGDERGARGELQAAGALFDRVGAVVERDRAAALAPSR
jgi:class 3 adenylate cyclase